MTKPHAMTVFRKGRLGCVLFLSCSIAAACSHNAVEPSTPFVGSLIIKPQPASLFIGDSARLSAVANRSDGAEEPVNAKWTTDDPTVARIDGGGLLTTTGAGAVNVVATAGGTYATLITRVLPSFQGTWAGSLKATACIPATPSVCNSNLIGFIKPIRMTIVQNGDRVSGTMCSRG